jgi:hypothetical protein
LRKQNDIPVAASGRGIRDQRVNARFACLRRVLAGGSIFRDGMALKESGRRRIVTTLHGPGPSGRRGVACDVGLIGNALTRRKAGFPSSFDVAVMRVALRAAIAVDDSLVHPSDAVMRRGRLRDVE